MILPTYKGLYILTAKALEPYGEIKFGMSMRLQYRWHDYEMLKKNTIGYHKVYHLSERYKSSNVKWIESIILDRTKEFASELFNTEFRKMSWEDLDKIILDTLKEYNCDYLEDTEL